MQNIISDHTQCKHLVRMRHFFFLHKIIAQWRLYWVRGRGLRFGTQVGSGTVELEVPGSVLTVFSFLAANAKYWWYACAFIYLVARDALYNDIHNANVLSLLSIRAMASILQYAFWVISESSLVCTQTSLWTKQSVRHPWDQFKVTLESEYCMITSNKINYQHATSRV